MSEIKGNKKIVGKINAKTLRATTTVPDWLQPLIKENGVYVGTEEPTDPTKLVWINPDGEASDLDLSNYYTKDETDSLIDTAVQNIDLSSYATKVELENYDTSEQVDAKINAIEIPEGIQHVTITNATELLNLENGLYIVDGDFTVETISYQEQSFGGLMSVNWHSYIFINYGATLLYNDGDATWDCIYLAFRSEIPDVSGFALKTEIPSIEGLATETYVQEKIAAIPEVDLSSYALKTEIPTVPTKTSDLTNDSGFITVADIPEVDLSNYALKTEIPDVSAYQTQEQVNALINNALSKIGIAEEGAY